MALLPPGIEAVDPGVCNITLTLQVYAPWCTVLDTNSAHDTVRITVVDMRVVDIKFNHTEGDAADGIDIRENASTDISVPEWVEGGQNKPAAYKKATAVTIAARLSPLLTVWRVLHLEIDSMEADPQAYPDKSPDIYYFLGESVQVNSPEAGQTTIDTYGPLYAPCVDFYEGGYVADTWLIISHTDDQIVVEGVLTQQDIDDIVGKVVWIRDDDELGQLPYYPSLAGFVAGAYSYAYITIETLDNDLNPNQLVPFNLNLNDLELAWHVDYDNAQDVWSSEEFWASLLVMCYQPKKPADGDPDSYWGANNSGQSTRPEPYDLQHDYGVTVEDDDNASCIFVEVIRDVGAPPMAYQPDCVDLPHVIAHEIGHAGGPSNDPDHEHTELGIMSAVPAVKHSAFSPATLKRFRESVKW